MSDQPRDAKTFGVLFLLSLSDDLLGYLLLLRGGIEDGRSILYLRA